MHQFNPIYTIHHTIIWYDMDIELTGLYWHILATYAGEDPRRRGTVYHHFTKFYLQASHPFSAVQLPTASLFPWENHPWISPQISPWIHHRFTRFFHRNFTARCVGGWLCPPFCDGPRCSMSHPPCRPCCSHWVSGRLLAVGILRAETRQKTRGIGPEWSKNASWMVFGMVFAAFLVGLEGSGKPVQREVVIIPGFFPGGFPWICCQNGNPSSWNHFVVPQSGLSWFEVISYH